MNIFGKGIQGFVPQNSVAITGGTISIENDIEITDATKGLILRDSGATRYRVTIDTGGALNITSL